MTAPRNALGNVIRSSLSKWPCFTPGYGANADEIAAASSLRADYASRLYDSLGSVAHKTQDKSRLLSALGQVMAAIEAESPGRGVPGVSVIVRRVSEIVLPAEDQHRERPWCAECVSQGGVRMAADAPFSPKRRADVTPNDRNGPRRPLCVVHLAEESYRSAHRLWSEGMESETEDGEGRRHRFGISTFEPQPPASLLPSVRSEDSDRWLARLTSEDA